MDGTLGRGKVISTVISLLIVKSRRPSPFPTHALSHVIKVLKKYCQALK